MLYDVPSTDDRDVWNVYLSPLWSASVYAANELGLFATLAQRAASPAELAETSGLNPRGLRAVLPLLACLGFLVQRSGRYQLNDAGRLYMAPGSPFYWGPVWAKKRRRSPDADFIVAALRATPSEGNPHTRPWEAPEMTPEMAQSVAETMNVHSLAAAHGIARNFNFRTVQRLLDVGGGGGCYSIVFAQRYPHLHCTVLDLPPMCEVVRRNAAAAEVDIRVDTAALDMFRQSWPRGHDTVFLSNVLHDWNDNSCAELLSRALEALPAGGRVLLHEMLLDDTGAGPLIAAAFSVLMLGTQGRQRTFGELAELLTAAGFIEPQVDATSVFFSVVSARKP